MPDIISLEELEQELNPSVSEPGGRRDEGCRVFDTLKTVAKGYSTGYPRTSVQRGAPPVVFSSIIVACARDGPVSVCDTWNPASTISGARLLRNTIWNLLGVLSLFVGLAVIPALIAGGQRAFWVLTIAWMVIVTSASSTWVSAGADKARRREGRHASSKEIAPSSGPHWP